MANALFPRPVEPAETIDRRDKRFVELFSRLLSLASDIAPASRALGTDAFRQQVELYRNQLDEAKDPRHVNNVVSAAIRLCEDFFGRSTDYLAEREKEFRELILILRDAVGTLAGRGEAFHGEMMETTVRLSQLSDLEDIRTLKRRLSEEVDVLKRAVEQKQRDDHEHFQELTERVGRLESSLEQSKKEALVDALTGVPNRRAFDSALAEWLQDPTGSGFVLGMLDLDDFKQVNDEHGHVVGDRVLRCAASALAEGVRRNDFVARYGGEEFAVMLRDTGLKDGRERLSAILDQIGASRYKYRQLGEDRWVRFTLSAGLTEVSAKEPADEALKRADEALYLAKKRGKNCVASKKKGFFGRLT